MNLVYLCKDTTQTKDPERWVDEWTGMSKRIVLFIDWCSRVLFVKGLGSRRGEIGPAIEMYTDLKYVYMVYFMEKNRNFICLVLKMCKLWVT